MKNYQQRSIRYLLLSFSVLAIFSLLFALVQVLVFPHLFAHASLGVDNSQLANIWRQGESGCTQPPQNTNLITLSDAQLMMYGFPTHAVLDANPQYWSTRLAHSANRGCGSIENKQHRTHGLGPRSSASLGFLPNWAANIAYGSRGTYKEASFDFTVPRVVAIQSDVSLWTGVGGENDFGSPTVLVQAGVDIQSNGNFPQYNESFWEVYPYNTEQNLPLSRLNIGDHVYAYISSNYKGDGYDYFYILNETANSYNSYTTYNKNYFSDSATGECVGERPTQSDGSYEPLANFGTVQFNNCDIGTDSKGQGVNYWSHNYYYMTSDGTATGRLLASVGAITGTCGCNYPVIWKNYF